jgi:type II secretory pathway predicted ATPase ExeA
MFDTAPGQGFTSTAAHDEALARCEFLLQRRRPWGLISGPAGTGKSALLRRLRSDSRALLGTSAVWMDATGAGDEQLLYEIAQGLGLGGVSRDPMQVSIAIRDRLDGQAQCEERRLVLIDHLDSAADSLLPSLRQLLRGASVNGAFTVIAAARVPLSAELQEIDLDFGSVAIEAPPLGRDETNEYLRGALRRGSLHERSFDLDAFDALFRLSGGRPRQIDRLCELALLAREVEQAERVSADLLAAAAQEMPDYAAIART